VHYEHFGRSRAHVDFGPNPLPSRGAVAVGDPITISGGGQPNLNQCARAVPSSRTVLPAPDLRTTRERLSDPRVAAGGQPTCPTATRLWVWSVWLRSALVPSCKLVHMHEIEPLFALQVLQPRNRARSRCGATRFYLVRSADSGPHAIDSCASPVKSVSQSCARVAPARQARVALCRPLTPSASSPCGCHTPKSPPSSPSPRAARTRPRVRRRSCRRR